jgi:hypothetical protein
VDGFPVFIDQERQRVARHNEEKVALEEAEMKAFVEAELEAQRIKKQRGRGVEVVGGGGGCCGAGRC